LVTCHRAMRTVRYSRSHKESAASRRRSQEVIGFQ
jgi:hypothetical protein